MVFFLYNFIQILIEHSVYAISAEPDQTPRSAASDLVLHCLTISHKIHTRLIWVNSYFISTGVNARHRWGPSTILGAVGRNGTGRRTEQTVWSYNDSQTL